MNALGSVILYTGCLAGLVALACLVPPLRFLGLSNRRRAGALLGLSVVLVVLAMTLPAPVQHAVGQTALDRVLPVYQFGEAHEIRVRATPALVFEAIRAVTPHEIRGYGLLTWLRSPRLRGGGREGLLNASSDKPILTAAEATGFLTIADRPDDQIVLGGIVPMWRPDRSAFRGLTRESAEQSLHADPDAFARFNPAGCAKIVFDFTVLPDGPGQSRLATRTRIFATSPGARRAFAAYWRVIYPGSAYIRKMWLEAIRRRAEAAL